MGLALKSKQVQEFKETEIGKIPVDWEVKELKQVADVIDPHPSHRAPKEVQVGFPFAGIGDIDEDGTIDLESSRKISEEFVKNLKTSMPSMVFIYSENSAKNYLSILKKYDLFDVWMDTNLMCLGEKASAILNEIKWKKIFIFNPGEEEFLLYKI